MGLSYTGVTFTTSDGHFAHQAKDADDQTVVVVITDAVTTDYGESAAKRVADQLHAANPASSLRVDTTAMKAAGY